jgi:hypothetical protein
MKALKRAAFGLLAVVVLFVATAYLLPRHYRVERSAVIRASRETVHAQLADLRAWRNWGVWYDRDPALTSTYSEQQGVAGAWSEWKSQSEGNGKATLTAVGGDKITYTLEFPAMGMKSTGTFALSAEAGGLRVVWSDEGDLGLNPVRRWLGLLLDRIIGPDVEGGLAKLKRNLEK